MKKVIALLLALAMCVAMVACGSQPSAPANGHGSSQPNESNGPSAASDEPYNIIILAKSIATDNWQMFRAGVEAAAAEIGTDKVNVVFDGPSGATEYEEQLNMIENYITGGCDAISVAPCSTEAVIPTLTQAHENGVVVGITDTAVEFDAYDNFTAFDNYLGGEFAAEAMVEALKAGNIDYAGKKIIMICPVPGVQTLDDRMAGFTAKLNELAPELEVVDPYYCDGDNNVALSNAQDAWQAYGEEIVGMYGLDEGVCDAISRCMDENSLQGKFQIVGIDATSLSVADVDKGNVYAVIGMSMYNMGYSAVMNMYNVCAGNAVEKDTILDPNIITAENAHDDDIRPVWDSSILG